MSDIPFSMPRRGDADVVNGVSYSGTTLSLTRAEGSDLTTTIATGDPVTGVSYSGDTLSLSRATGTDLTTTIATSDPTKIENGNSKMEIASANGACVFTPAGLTAKTTTFAADGDIITSGYVGIGDDAPDAPLQIKGDGGGDSALRVESTNAAGAGFMYLQRNTDGKSYVLNRSNHPLLLGANNDATQLYLKENGNVGINDTAPSQKLSVNGGLYVEGGEGIRIPREGLYDSPDTRTWQITHTLDTGVVNKLAFRFIEDDVVETDNIAFGGDGSIACSGSVTAAANNTTSRSEFGITAIGYIGHSNAAGFSHTSTATATNYALMQTESGNTYVNAASGRQIRFRVNNTDKMYISSIGNVGINNTNPEEKLHVTGNIRLSGILKCEDYILLSGVNPQIIANTGYLDVQSEGDILFTSDFNGGESGGEYQFKSRRSGSVSAAEIMNLNGDTGNLVVKGTVTPNGSFSDDRLKTDEAYLENATESIGKLSVQTYNKEQLLNFNLLERTGETVREVGVIAQEVYYNAPEFRNLIETGYNKTYDASYITYEDVSNTTWDGDVSNTTVERVSRVVPKKLKTSTKIIPSEMDLSGVPIGEDPDYEAAGWSKEQPASVNYQGLSLI